jgi:ubiquinone/menaquinone biosynthesis C-methylase UbiE
VIAITVLYTVADDTLAMHELARVLRPGGAAVFVEPTFESLRRAHDTAVHSRRRYRHQAAARPRPQPG